MFDQMAFKFIVKRSWKTFLDFNDLYEEANELDNKHF